VSSQSAPECTVVIPDDHTYVASDILLTLDCSDNICGCHLLHSLCNHPLNKPLHPPEPSALPPSSPTFGRRKGEAYTVYTGETRFLIQAQLHLCLRKMHPNIRYNPSREYGYCEQYPPNARLLRQHMRLSFARPLCNHPFNKPLHPPEPAGSSPFLSDLRKRKGEAYTVYTGETRFLIQGQLHLCLRKVHPNIRYNPSREYVCRKRYPPNARMLRQYMRLSFASPLCNHPFNKPLHPPEP